MCEISGVLKVVGFRFESYLIQIKSVNGTECEVIFIIQVDRIADLSVHRVANCVVAVDPTELLIDVGIAHQVVRQFPVVLLDKVFRSAQLNGPPFGRTGLKGPSRGEAAFGVIGLCGSDCIAELRVIYGSRKIELVFAKIFLIPYSVGVLDGVVKIGAGQRVIGGLQIGIDDNNPRNIRRAYVSIVTDVHPVIAERKTR